MSGSGSRSPHWPQMMADVLEIPLTVAEARETAALGAAIGVTVAVSHYLSYEDAVRAMPRVARDFRPEAKRFEHFRRRYAIYAALTGQMRNFWNALKN